MASRKAIALLRPVAEKAFSRKYLLLTNATLGGLFMTAADTMQQKFEQFLAEHKKPFDTLRTKSMLGGGVFFGIMGHYWYKLLDTKYPGHSRMAVVKKIAWEAPAGPVFCLAFFLVVGRLQGKPTEQIWLQFKENVLWLCVADWMFYLPFQTLNFLYMPPQYRFLYVACLNLVYDTFLSFIIHREKPEPIAAGTEQPTKLKDVPDESKTSKVLEIMKTR